MLVVRLGVREGAPLRLLVRLGACAVETEPALAWCARAGRAAAAADAV